MFKLALFFLSVLSVTAFSKTDRSIFTKTSELTTHYQLTFAEIHGVEMRAIEEALNDCRRTGTILCSFVSINPTYYNSFEIINSDRRRSNVEWTTKISAIVRNLEDKKLKEGNVFTKEYSLDFLGRITNTSELGVKRRALDKALSACYSEGNDYCVIISTNFSERGTPIYDDSRRNTLYRFTARATVKGYTLKTNFL